MSLTLHPLHLKDQFRAHQCMMSTALGGQTPLATWAFPPHYIWKNVLHYSWAEVNGWWCLFAEYAGGLFMPLPPLGPSPGIGSPSSGGLRDVLDHVMTTMETYNKGSQVTRIENIPQELGEAIRHWGYSLTQNDSHYLYQTADLVQMKANAYKAPRAAYNRFIRAHRLRVAPYRIMDRDACLALFDRWLHQTEEIAVPQIGPHGHIARVLGREAGSAQRIILQEYRELGLTGYVVWVDGSIKAYAFGYPRSREVFCLLVEVADRSIAGLATYLFREFCRTIQQYPLLNTMSDSGLPSVARTKHAYRPTQLVSNFIVHPMR